jgi:hypothetical protein
VAAGAEVDVSQEKEEKSKKKKKEKNGFFGGMFGRKSTVKMDHQSQPLPDTVNVPVE